MGSYDMINKFAGAVPGSTPMRPGYGFLIKSKGDGVLTDNEWRRNTYDRIKQVHEN